MNICYIGNKLPLLHSTNIKFMICERFKVLLVELIYHLMTKEFSISQLRFGDIFYAFYLQPVNKNVFCHVYNLQQHAKMNYYKYHLYSKLKWFFAKLV